MKIYIDKQYHFYELYNEMDGTLVRSNVYETGKDPFIRSFPELLDIGIMGSCEAGKSGICKNAGVDCYQSAYMSDASDMSLQDYEWLIDQCKEKVFQVALGGAGDPNKHIHFEEILYVTRKYGIVPNLTTSGYSLLDKEISVIKKYCGAVAVSYYSRLINGQESNEATIEAISRFVNVGCITNIHFVISSETIEEAIYRLENNVWPKGINAIIFILYKPVGLGMSEKMVIPNGTLDKFLELAISKKYSFRVGFDTCFTSALCRKKGLFNTLSIDACEAARFSMYVDSGLNAYPCSFDNQVGKYRIKLKPATIQDVWDSKLFANFRKFSKKKCMECHDYEICRGGCALKLGIELCDTST